MSFTSKTKKYFFETDNYEKRRTVKVWKKQLNQEER